MLRCPTRPAECSFDTRNTFEPKDRNAAVRQVFMRKKLLQPATVGPEQVPVPRCAATGVLIGNRCSLISAGTESSSVKRNVKDMVVKAMTTPALRQKR